MYNIKDSKGHRKISTLLSRLSKFISNRCTLVLIYLIVGKVLRIKLKKCNFNITTSQIDFQACMANFYSHSAAGMTIFHLIGISVVKF